MNIYYYLHRKCSITKFINPLNQQRTHAFYWPECHLFTVSRYLSGSSGLASVNKKHLLCHMTHYIPSFNPTTISLPLRLENNSQLLIKVYPGKEFIRKNFVNSPERERDEEGISSKESLVLFKVRLASITAYQVWFLNAVARRSTQLYAD